MAMHTQQILLNPSQNKMQLVPNPTLNIELSYNKTWARRIKKKSGLWRRRVSIPVPLAC